MVMLKERTLSVPKLMSALTSQLMSESWIFWDRKGRVLPLHTSHLLCVCNSISKSHHWWNSNNHRLLCHIAPSEETWCPHNYACVLLSVPLEPTMHRICGIPEFLALLINLNLHQYLVVIQCAFCSWESCLWTVPVCHCLFWITLVLLLLKHIYPFIYCWGNTFRPLLST